MLDRLKSMIRPVVITSVSAAMAKRSQASPAPKVAPHLAPQVTPNPARAARMPDPLPGLGPLRARSGHPAIQQLEAPPQAAPEPAPAAFSYVRRLTGTATIELPNSCIATRPAFAVTEGSRRAVRRIWSAGDAAPLDPPSAEEHAYRLLEWLRSIPLLAGHDIPAVDLRKLYPLFCRSLNLGPHPWQTVARNLRVLTGGDRHYRRVHGKKIRVYPIPNAPLREPEHKGDASAVVAATLPACARSK